MKTAQSYLILLIISLIITNLPLSAAIISGSDWNVIWNRPDQNSSLNTPEEFDIRDALIARINALGSNHSAFLSTFTFSGNATGAGSILTAIYNRLSDPTVSNLTIRMNIDKNINPSTLYNTGGSSPFYSISGLASTVFPNGNAFYYDRGTYPYGIMHNKFSLFDYGPGNRWIHSSSANYTGGSAIFQWNISFEVRNDALYALYLGEANQLMGTDTNTSDGIYHDNPTKSHAFDLSPPSISFDGGNGLIGVRFGPHPDSIVPGGNNAASEIISAINSAQYSILLGTNKLSSMQIANALINACNNGVEVHLIISQSDVTGSGDSVAVYNHLNNPANYADAAAFARFFTYIADRDGATAGLQPDNPLTDQDLVHTKYLVIDAGTPNAQVIHGSANFTNQALNGTNLNDENILFIKSTSVANAFVQHAQAMTAGQIPALPVPEPSTYAFILLGLGLGSLILSIKSNKHKTSSTPVHTKTP
ncbi:MAG: phospholipase D-like domain-containing protein [Methylacidiphilales bacterium]|nr:phospholipase D-like domain-containing protein [Candidatus Methylacidiphilales bacterium]MDW8349998.1 phospholipase D-like domain-containing protein [Verrucomicrobiae bacterium]